MNWDLAVLLTLPDPVPAELSASLRLERRLARLQERLDRAAPPQVRDAVDAFLSERLQARLGIAPRTGGEEER